MRELPGKRGSSAAGHGRLVLWAVLFVVWAAANSTLAVDVLVTGLVVTGGLAFACAGRDSVWSFIRTTPSALKGFVVYTWIFVVEMIKANLAVMRIVYSPTIRIRPEIVAIRTRLTSAFGRLSLANTIVLTPGTVIVDVHDDTFFVHCLDSETGDIETASSKIAGPFEKSLGQVFG